MSRLSKIVESTTALSDSFANDIMYHHACWLKYITNTKLQQDDAMHFQNVNLSETRQSIVL